MANTVPGSGLVVLDCLIIINNVNADNTGYIAYHNNSTGTGSSTNAQLLGINKYGCSQYMMWEEKGMRIGLRSVTNGGTGDLHFTAGSDSAKMIIRCTGNTDIQSGGILNIYRADNTRALQLYTTNDETVIDSWAASSEPLMIRSNGTGGRIVFHTNGAERLRINCAGNVGIGTTTPQVALDIRGSSEGLHMYRDGGNAPDIRLKTSNGTIASPSIVCNGNLAGQIHFEAHDGSAYLSPAGIWGVVNGIPSTNNIPIDLLFYTGTLGKNERMRITSGGSIGVGTCTPSYRLHVNGTFYAAGSSQDYKEGICQYNTDSCLFMCLKPKKYQYKDEWKHLGKDLKSETQIGLIAEEVAESHPELAILVNEEDNKVVRNVDYEKLSIILLSEVQKLRQEVDQLKNK
jgi:hypothetical protein